MSKKIKLVKDFSYPDPEDPDLLTKIFKKREFYYHKVPERKKMESYEEIQKYREQNCKEGEIVPREQQAIVPNFISPNTPYKGVILMHGTGSGKTGSAILIAEQFKEQVKKYNTKIFVIVPGPNTRDNFKHEILTWTGETYLKNKNIISQMTKAEREKEIKIAMYAASQYYKIMSYKSFHKKVLGEKIVEQKISDDNKRIKKNYKKTAEGEYEREIVVDRITNMDNAVLIVDEAHNISGNDWGKALIKIIKNSQNLRVILLTATPMINTADEIIDLLNFLRPENDQIEREKIFTGDKNYLMKLKDGGLNYLKEKAQGYISFYRGNIPFTFAKRIEKGEIPEGLLFTKVIKCYMEKFQDGVYLKTKDTEDNMYRYASASAMFSFPGLNKDKNDIQGYHSTEGLNIVLSQLNSDGPKLKSLINKKIFNGKLSKAEEENFMLETSGKYLKGDILKLDNLRHFSIKFYKVIKRLGKLVEGQKGASTAFIYSSLVNAGGMELFAEVLKKNGYLEYQDDPRNYDIKDETLDYKTGKTYAEFKKEKLTNFKPAAYILITGSSEESGEEISEVKQKVLKDVFNHVDNIDGKNIKLVLGTKVMNEGVTLKNCSEVHIIDVLYNIPKVEQVIGRAIRMCVHKDSITDENPFPKVNVYKYVIAREGELTSDEMLYKRAEEKYILIKEIERSLKEVALDCPLLLNANMFPEEIEKYKGCVPPTLENLKKGKKICPALCDFKECSLKCDNHKLNDKFWAGTKYKNLSTNEIDYNTFNDELAKFEIGQVKSKIKDLYRFKHVYLYDELLKEIKKSFLPHQADLFDPYFLDQALESMMPKSENDFNSFKDTVFDKYNRPGYLIQRGKYYIIQPFNEYEDVPMYYRQNVNIENTNKVSLKNYIKQKYGEVKSEMPAVEEKNINKKEIGYDFESIIDYYDERDENFIVGIIDKNFNKLASSDIDSFKIRAPRGKSFDKKRGTGIPTLKGAVCATSKDKDYLMNLIKKIPNISKKELERIDKLTREDICNEMRDKLLFLEKYSTSKDKNKITYVMIPANHPILPFPFNLEDRIKNYIKQIKKICERDVEIEVKKIKEGTFLGKKSPELISYKLVIKNEKFITQNEDIINGLNKLGFKKEGNTWEALLD